VSAAPDGVLVVDKPEGMTSHDVVAAVRRRLPRRTKVGHTGTLDPFATGVLPVVIGKATRLSQFLTASRKQYLADVAFGTATDTGDCMGSPTATAAQDALSRIDATVVRDALDAFVGTYLQVPPAHSTKKVDGERAYARARRGDIVDLPAVEVTAHAVSLVTWDDVTRTARVALEVAAGYYVRSLARDVGHRLGVPAHLSRLQRTGSGQWTLSDAHALEAILRGSVEDLAAWLQPLSALLPDWPAIALEAAQVQSAISGRLVTLDAGQAEALGDAPSARVRLLDDAGDLVALARPAHGADTVHADVVLR
jgi:tRNA pseudouridine55 synthase